MEQQESRLKYYLKTKFLCIPRKQQKMMQNNHAVRFAVERKDAYDTMQYHMLFVILGHNSLLLYNNDSNNITTQSLVLIIIISCLQLFLLFIKES